MKSCLLVFPVPKEPHKLISPELLCDSHARDGFFPQALFPHPVPGAREVHVNGWMVMEFTTPVQTLFFTGKMGLFYNPER